MISGGKPTKWYIVVAFLLPSLLGFGVFIILPIIASIGLAFTNYSGGFNLDYVGLDNFHRALIDGAFLNSLWITGKFMMSTVVFQIILGFIFAVLLNKKIFGKNAYRAILFLPVVLSSVAISLVFMLMLNPDKGPINNFLLFLGMSASPWLTSPKTALTTIVMVSIWQSFGYYMVLFLGGLQSINKELYEAAAIDGATEMQKLLKVTVPLLSPTTFLCIIMAIINAFKVFDQIFIMTGGQDGGGPAGSTSVLVFKIYQDAFSHYKMGFASAEATILLLMVLVITIIQYRGQNKWVSYE